MAKTTHPPHLLLHNLISAFSYWGTTVRGLLVGFMLLIGIVLNAIESTSTPSLSQYAIQFIYLIGSLLVLDAGYVTIARALPISTETIDRVLFLLFFAALALVIIMPYFMTVPTTVFVSIKWVLLVAMFVLALRLVLGFFFGHRANER